MEHSSSLTKVLVATASIIVILAGIKMAGGDYYSLLVVIIYCDYLLADY